MIPKSNLPRVIRDLLRPEETVHMVLKNRVNIIHYVITNLRVINCIKPNHLRSCYFSQVYQVAIGTRMNQKRILLITQPNVKLPLGQENQHLGFAVENLRDTSEVRNLIVSLWNKESPYAQRVKYMRRLADQYGLALSLPKTNTRTFLKISGELDGMKCIFFLDNIYKMKQLTIRFFLPNPKNTFIRIKKEKLGNGLEKLFGAGGQDIQVNRKEFDNFFFIKSSDQKLIRYALTYPVQQLMMDAWRYFDSQITWGDLPVTKKKTSKDKDVPEFDILDEGLLHEFFPDTANYTEELIPLTYHCPDVGGSLFNVQIILNHCIKNFEVMYSIAGRIQDYYLD